MEDNKGLFEKVYCDEKLLEMSFHPTPIEEVDPLLLDTIKEEQIKKEVCCRNDEDEKFCCNIFTKEEIGEDEMCDLSWQQTNTLSATSISRQVQHKVGNMEYNLSTLQNNENVLISSDFTTKESIKQEVDNGSTVVNSETYNCNNIFIKYESLDEESADGKQVLVDNNYCDKESGLLVLERDTEDELVNEMASKHKCNACEKSFTNLSSLKKHLRVHVGGTHKCKFCEKLFFESVGLIMHEKMHTSSKLYRCSDCEKSFSQPSYLRIHRIMHTGDQLYKCNECNISFSQLSELKKHEKVHLIIKPYICSFCRKSFSSPSNLIRHEKIIQCWLIP